jgi:mannosyltransferase OCH1-like enzyme
MKHSDLKKILLENPPKDDAEKLNIYLKFLDSEVDLSCEYSNFFYWDELSVLAFYQNKHEIALESFEKILELDCIPEEQKNRIYTNSIPYNFLDPKKILSHKIFLKQLTDLKLKLQNQYNTIGNIPNIIHFIYLKGIDFQLHHYLAIKSAKCIMNWDKIFIYNDSEPENNIWWKLTKQLDNVNIINIIPPAYINKTYLLYKQHIADIMRLEILKMFGGIYFDLDMLTYKNFQNLLLQIKPENEIMLCRENNQRISNSMIAAIPNSKFINEWIDEYHTNYGNKDIDFWGGLSVEKPNQLSKKYKDIIILDSNTFLPFDYFHTDFFTKNTSNIDYTNTYGIHLWDTEQQKRNILPKNIENMKESKSTFWNFYKDILEEDLIISQIGYLQNKIQILENEIKELKKS